MKNEEKLEFKIGDKVQVIGKTKGSENKIGDIGIITYINKFSIETWARVECDNKAQSCDEYFTNLKLFVEETPNFKVIDPNTVENKEGNVFIIGDNVTVTNDPEKLQFNIIHFEKSNGNKKMLAVTNCKHRKKVYIDKLEHVLVFEEKQTIVESKVETLLKKAKRLYPNGTRYIPIGSQCELQIDNEIFIESRFGIHLEGGRGWLFFNSKWAKIIEPEFTLPENWHIVITAENQEIVSKRYYDNGFLVPISNICGNTKCNNRGITKGHNFKNMVKSGNMLRYDFGTEITFDQFKKHVLIKNIKK